MNKISNLSIKITSSIIFLILIIATYNSIIPKNIFYLFLKLIFLIPFIALIVNIANIVPRNLLTLFSKIFGAVSLIFLIVISYLSSKRKPDSFGELFDKWDNLWVLRSGDLQSRFLPLLPRLAHSLLFAHCAQAI